MTRWSVRCVAGLAAFALLLAACKHLPEPAPVPVIAANVPTKPYPVDPPLRPGPMVFAVGQSARIGGSASLHFKALTSDSRCPPKVQCIWAGEVTLSFILEDGSGAAGFELSSSTKPKATVGGHDFELTAYGACPSGTAGECATVTTAPAP